MTGGAGFIGSHIVDYLVSNGSEVVVLDDFSSGNLANLQLHPKSKKLRMIKADINDARAVKRAMRDVEIVFHEAAITSVQRSISEPEFTNHVNVDGTENMLRCCVDSNVHQFVFASSAAVYGEPQVLPIAEDSLTLPISPYGFSKLKGESLCLRVNKENGLKTTILRNFNVYGPRSLAGDYSGVISKFANRVMNGKSPIIYGDGKQTRDFIYVEDVVRANILALSNYDSNSKIFNLASGVQVTIKSLAEVIGHVLLGKSSNLSVEYQDEKRGDIRKSYADITLIRKELSFKCKYSLEEGIRLYLKWLAGSDKKDGKNTLKYSQAL